MPERRIVPVHALCSTAPGLRMARIGISRQQARAGICTAIAAISSEKSFKQLQLRDARKRHARSWMLQIPNGSREMRQHVARRTL
jgi:hypothetical protein